MKTLIRKADNSEINWINSKYQEVDFKPSNFDNEYIVIAEYDNKKAGLGRLVKIDDENLELGGIYVFKDFRKLGIADKIVSALCHQHQLPQKTIWCLPFEHLQEFYEKFGFIPAEKSTISIPKDIAKKHQWCNTNYDKNVLLLVKFA